MPEDLLFLKDFSCFSVSVNVITMLVCSFVCALSGLTNARSLLSEVSLLFVFLKNANRFSTAFCLPPFIILQYILGFVDFIFLRFLMLKRIKFNKTLSHCYLILYTCSV